MTITAFFSVMPNPDSADALQAYSEKAGPMLGAIGGTNGRRVKIGDAIIGDQPGFAMAMMMDFPSREALEGMFASEEYKELIPLREAAFASFTCVIGEAA
ncbi:MAG: DUF1330 domain-containing protein [Pseudomonadota bacterium]